MMSRIGKMCLVMALTCSSAVLCGCETKQQREEKALKVKALEIENNKKANEFDFRRAAVLLSLKYKIEEESVFNLLVDENGMSLENIENMEDSISGKSTRRNIQEYSKKYEIPQDVIAGIFIDYDTMTKDE